MRIRVPKHNLGADQLVVAMKLMKINGAKGLNYPVLLFNQP